MLKLASCCAIYLKENPKLHHITQTSWSRLEQVETSWNRLELPKRKSEIASCPSNKFAQVGTCWNTG